MADQIRYAHGEIKAANDIDYVMDDEIIKHNGIKLKDVVNAAQTALNSKTDKSYVDSELAKKADAAALNGKADASVVAQLQANVNTKADASTVSVLSERVSTNETNIATANSRIDEIVAIPPGSTEGNTELIDIRTGADGKKYPTAGDAVRGQVTDLKSDLNHVNKNTAVMDAVNRIDKSINLITVLDFVPDGYRHFGNGEYVPNGSYTYTKNFTTTEGTVYECDSTTGHVCFFDANGVYISGVVTNQTTGGIAYGSKFTAPMGAYFMCISVTKATKDSVYLKIIGKSTNLNIISIMNFVSGKYRHFSNGEILPSGTYSYSRNINVKSGDEFYCDSTTGHVCFFDSSGEYVSGVLTNQTSGGVKYGSTFTVPTGATQMCISLTTATIPTTTLKYDTGNSSKMVVVDINGTGDYTSVVEAVASEPENTTIYIKPGVYMGTVQAFEKRVILKGEDRNTCIIRSTNGGYNFPAINCSCGYFENLTFDAQYTNESSEIGPQAETAAYAVHCEHEYGAYKSLEIYHCTLKSDFFSALGIGVRKGFTLTIVDSELINNQTPTRGPAYADISGGKGLGALFLHDSVGAQGDSYVKIYNSVFKSTLGNAMCLYNARGGDNKVHCEFVNNTLYDRISGLSNNLFKRGGTFSNVFLINGISHGNTNAELNA